MVEKGGKLYGRGTADMKCFPAVALALVPEFLKRDLKVPIHIALTYDEEIGCLSAWSLADQMKEQLPKPHALIVGEPTMMQVVHSHKAINSFFTEFTGHEAHSSLVESGVSAIHFAGELIYFLNRVQDELRARAKPSEFAPPYGTINVGIVQGGTAGNILARNCFVQWEYRALPSDDPMEVLHRVRHHCDNVLLPRMRQYAPDALIETRARAGVPPLLPEQHNPADALCRHLTGANASASVPYAAEAGIFQKAGFHVVICGPGDIAQAHQPNEFIETSQVAACESFMRRLADWSVKGGANH
jgi:acetylornithine deacetylase